MNALVALTASDIAMPRYESMCRRSRGVPASSLSVRSLAGIQLGKPGENQKALAAIETLSELDITPEQFAKFTTANVRDRVLLAISMAIPWLDAVRSAVNGE
jgi:hypothetical protein